MNKTKKQTKKEVRKSSKKIVAVIAVFGIITTLLAVALVSSAIVASNYEIQLENVYERSFYELISNVNELEVEMSKSLISTSAAAQEETFYTIWQQCDRASTNLSRLPLAHQSINQTTEFINTLGGFSYYLLNKTKDAEEITDADYSSLTELYDMCSSIKKILNDYYSTLQNNYRIIDDINFEDTTVGMAGMFDSMQNTGVEYPSLIYDGPFSTSVLNKEIKGLGEFVVGEEEARQVIETAFSNYLIDEITLTNESKGRFETYNFNITTQNGKIIFAQVTKQGGMLLTVSSYASTNASIFSVEDCKIEAEDFAKNLGFENMQSVWSSNVGNVCYVNLTSVIDDAVVYPEMIKVKVSMDTLEIIGWEASSYALNKTDRTIETAIYSANEAMEKVSNTLNIESAQLSIIPIDYKSDKLCWEFKCTLNNDEYYIYINAMTNEEENILKIIKTDSGDLML